MANITIAARDGSGTFSAYIAYPAQTPAPAVVVIQEIFGVNADIRAKCDEWAAQGYVAIAPDLFWRQEANVDLTDKTQAEWDKALALLGGFDLDRGVDDLAATPDIVRADPACNGRAGCVGYCLGGRLAYLMAARTNIDASVGYYAIALDTMLDEAAHIKNPLLLHVAELDKFVPPVARDAVLAHFKGHTLVKTELYAGVDHAFARKNGQHYDAAAATLADARTRDFFARHLKK